MHELGRYSIIIESLQSVFSIVLWQRILQAVFFIVSEWFWEDNMDEKELIRCAEALGFTKASFISTDMLEFDAGFRRFCKENLCGNYGRNYGCPPDCGTTGEMEEKVRGYENALVVQTVYTVENIRNSRETAPLKKQHNQRSRKLETLLKQKGMNCLPILAGPCSLCGQCAKVNGEPCRFPDEIASCLSAYCIKAEKMAEVCEMLYWGGENRAAFFSLFLMGNRGQKE